MKTEYTLSPEETVEHFKKLCVAELFLKDLPDAVIEKVSLLFRPDYNFSIQPVVLVNVHGICYNWSLIPPSPHLTATTIPELMEILPKWASMVAEHAAQLEEISI